MDKLEKLRELYEKIPSTRCADGCDACCHDLIQMSPEERDSMGGYEFTGKCVHLVDGRCGVYERRPFVCRLYGASELLRCDGCKPESLLSEEQTKSLLKIYARINEFK